MIESLRDPAVQFVIAIGAVIVPILIYWKQHKRKSLDYMVVSFIPLSSIDPNILWSYQQAGLQFTFNNKAIPQAHIITIRFTNSGNVPMPRGDYEQPVSLSFGEKAEVLAFRLVERKPETIQLKLNSDGRNVIIEKTLLNSKDSFVIEALVSGFDGSVRVGGRIIGVKEMKDVGGGLPTSREEELIDEAIIANLFILLFAVVSGWFAAVVAIGILMIQILRKIKLKILRQTSASRK